MKPFLETKDFAISGENFKLVHNQDLDMLETRPAPENLAKYYQSDGYISHTDANESLVDKVYQRVKKYSIARKVKLITSYDPSGKSLLDIGAGTGDFLLAAKSRGWAITGIEPNAIAREKAIEKGVHLEDSLSTVAAQKFDVITLWHVLEHLPNLNQQLESITALLKESGTLIVAVPNFKSYDAMYYGQFWAAYDVPRHLWHFSRTAIKKIFYNHRIKLIGVRPMIFDAYYVALLSEKYKTGKRQLLKSFYIGLRSNLKAWHTKEYSSHIYILKKA